MASAWRQPWLPAHLPAGALLFAHDTKTGTDEAKAAVVVGAAARLTESAGPPGGVTLGGFSPGRAAPSAAMGTWRFPAGCQRRWPSQSSLRCYGIVAARRDPLTPLAAPPSTSGTGRQLARSFRAPQIDFWYSIFYSIPHLFCVVGLHVNSASEKAKRTMRRSEVYRRGND